MERITIEGAHMNDNDKRINDAYEAPRVQVLGSLHELTQGGVPGGPSGFPGGDHGSPWHHGSF
jgi:hypothetical protein